MWKANTVPFFAGKVGIFNSTSGRDLKNISIKNNQILKEINEEIKIDPNLNDYEKIMVVGQGNITFKTLISSNFF